MVIIQAAISCLTMPEQHPVKSASSFLGHLITVSREVEPLVPLVNTHGEQLFLQVILPFHWLTDDNSIRNVDFLLVGY